MPPAGRATMHTTGAPAQGWRAAWGAGSRWATLPTQPHASLRAFPDPCSIRVRLRVPPRPRRPPRCRFRSPPRSPALRSHASLLFKSSRMRRVRGERKGCKGVRRSSEPSPCQADLSAQFCPDPQRVRARRCRAKMRQTIDGGSHVHTRTNTQTQLLASSLRQAVAAKMERGIRIEDTRQQTAMMQQVINKKKSKQTPSFHSYKHTSHTYLPTYLPTSLSLSLSLSLCLSLSLSGSLSLSVTLARSLPPSSLTQSLSLAHSFTHSLTS
jgi:hypothetical protein